MGMPATVRGESLLATTGVTAALRPGPVAITMKVLRSAEGLGTHIRRRLRKFCRSPELAPPAELADFDFEEISKLLTTAQNEVNQVENVSNFYDPGLAMEYAEVLGTAVGYLQSIVPSEPMPQMFAGKPIRPSELDVSEFRRRYAVVDAPLTALDSLCSGFIVPEEVEALETVYAGLYAFMRQALEQEMIEALAAKESYRLPYAKQQALEVFLQTETLDPALAGELQKAFDDARKRESAGKSAPQPQQGGPAMANPHDPTNPATQQDKLEAR